MMGNRYGVVVLSSIDWGFLWQRHQTFAARFAEAGMPTVFVESTGKRLPRIREAGRVVDRLKRWGNRPRETGTRNLRVLSPVTLPATNPAFNGINRWSFLPPLAHRCRQLLDGVDRVVMHVYLPTRASLELIRLIDPDVLVYDAVTRFDAMGRQAPRDVQATEAELLRAADVVIADSRAILERVRSVRPDAVHLPPGVDPERFSLARSATVDPDLLGFFGTIGEWVDVEILESLIADGFRLRLIGENRVGLAARPGQLELRGVVPHDQLPAAIRDCSALMIPYAVNDFTVGVFPAKAFECLATGKPLVCTDLPDLQALPRGLVGIINDAHSAPSAVRRCLAEDSPKSQDARQRAAAENTWTARFEVLRGLVESRLR